MANARSTESPLEAVADVVGSHAVDAFKLLGNETRLAILLALWEVYDPLSTDNAVPFSELYDRVGVRDSGTFTYHLDKLTGHFVEETHDGYELRNAGHQLVGTVIAGTGIEEPTLEPTEIDETCPHCGAPTAITYQDGKLCRICTECEGSGEPGENVPSGTIAGFTFDPAGLSDRTPEQMWTALLIRMRHTTQSAVEGVCAVCSGPTEISLHVCEEHASDGVCDTCGRRAAIVSRHRCPVCKSSSFGTPDFLLAWHPDVVGFYNERGVPMQYDLGDHPNYGAIAGETDHEIVSTDPRRVRVSFQYGGDRLEVLVDEEVNVLEVTESD